MNAVQDITAVIIGDSTNNTLSIIRSLGEADIKQCLILKCDEDVCFVSKSRYLKQRDIFQIKNINECLPILEDIKKHYSGRRIIICSFDEAAVFVDSHEFLLTVQSNQSACTDAKEEYALSSAYQADGTLNALTVQDCLRVGN